MYIPCIYTKPLKKAVPALVIAPIKDLQVPTSRSTRDKPCTKQLVCTRIHQLLFNEIVYLVAKKGDQVKVYIPNMFYVSKTKPEKLLSVFWTSKHNLIPLSALIPRLDKIKQCPKICEKTKRKKSEILKPCRLLKHKIKPNTMFIPKPIDHRLRNIERANKNIVTLYMPFHDPTTKTTFSAGTRFVKTKEQSIQNHATVYIYNPKTTSFKTIHIPKSVCVKQLKTNKEKRKQFLRIIKQWAHLPHGYIPYVWGGNSFTHARKDKRKKYNKYNLDKYIIPDTTIKPASGLDCSGLILRAAQICNINYFYKNSRTLKRYLKPIYQVKDLRNGDLIYYSGHVMIVSDIKNNKLLESKVNEYDISRVREINLNQAFQKIKTYKQLFNTTKKKMVNRLDINGNIIKRIKIGGVRFFKLINS